MKNVAYASISVLAVTLSFHLGAHAARAGASQVIGLGELSEFARLVLDSGEIVSWAQGFGWSNVVPNQLPFPPAELAFHTGRFVVDTSDNLWANVNSQWQFVGPPPAVAGIAGSPQLQPATWGDIKARAR